MSNPFEDANEFIREAQPKIMELTERLRTAGANTLITENLWNVLLAIEDVPEFDDEGNVLT